MDIARRFPENPILRPQDIRPSRVGLKVEYVINPGAFRYQEKTWLLLRVAERPEQKPGSISLPILGDGGVEILQFDLADPNLDRSDPRIIAYDGQQYLTTLSHLRLVSSEDGVHFGEPPGYPPVHGHGDLETFGIEDCRVTRIEDTYYLTFTSVSSHGVGVGMRSTRDWRDYTENGMILPPHNKDCALFDEQIGGRYYALHRPSSVEIGGNYLWIAESPDLWHWGGHRCLAMARPGMWDQVRIGAGAAPIRTGHGWLVIYHGADAGSHYCLGAILLDLEQPWRVLARSEEPIMEPTFDYERTGFFGEVVFCNGHVVDGDEITIYYGAADSVTCGARFSISEILQSLGI